jgi:DNA-binding GntR family transcriptional regulator
VGEDILKKMVGNTPLTVDLLVNKIYSILEDNIINMTLPPESKLVEENIAHILGVSRSPVREALMRLEHSGLVVRKSSKERIVASFTEQDIIDKYEIWGMIEGYAGGHACLSAQDQDYAKIEVVLNQLKASTDNDDLYLCRQLNGKFHSEMVNPCPNKALVRMYENALKPIRWCWNLSMFWPRTISNLYSEHEQIYNAFKRRDRTTYEKLVRKHIHNGSERFRKEYLRRKELDSSMRQLTNGVAFKGKP